MLAAEGRRAHFIFVQLTWIPLFILSILFVLEILHTEAYL